MSTKTSPAVAMPKIATRAQWLKERLVLLEKEKQATRARDELAAQRRQLPMVKVEQPYTFDAPHGKTSLADLFGPHSQLIIYHFMFGPTWAEGCPSCSFVTDHLNPALPHLAARDTSLVLVSQAPLEKIQPFKTRMGWQLPWVASHNTTFNFDYHVSFHPDDHKNGAVYYNYTTQSFPSTQAPGLSVFLKDPATQAIYHTYSTYTRGLDHLITTYPLLDLTPRGRNESDLPFPMQWVRYHDQYQHGIFADKDKPYWPATQTSDAPTQPAHNCCNAQ